jgi:hypothetical protein
VTPRARRVVLFVVVLSLSPFAVIAVEQAPRLLETWHGPRDLEVVRTTDDLLATPAISLGKGVTIHLGIDATECPHGGAVLVYCATEGRSPDTGHETDDSLGPVRVGLVGHERLKRLEEHVAGARPDPALFVKAIPIAEPGPHEVIVSSRDGRTLARCNVRGTEEPFHSLAGFAYSTHDRYHDPSWLLESRDIPALPAFAGTVARALGQGDLPGLLGQRRLLLTKTGDVFTISAPDRLAFGEGIETGHLLGRWWLNDRPLIMSDVPAEALEHSHFGKYVLERSHHFRLARTATGLRARRGDTVGLELVYCPDGWTPARERGGLEQNHEHGWGTTPLRTNRIDFVLP